jgi:hypothetical protein
MKTKICLLFLVLTPILSIPASEITNSVNITTNLVFRLANAKVDDAQSQFKSDEIIRYKIAGTSTNIIGARHFPSGNFDFHLFDADGSEVSKTKVGLALTGTPPKPTEAGITFYRTSGFSPFFVNEEIVNQNLLFRPDDVFVITNKGVYELEVKARICVIMINGSPDLKAMTDWRNVYSRGYKFYKDFGVLTSPPLRVKVIKE